MTAVSSSASPAAQQAQTPAQQGRQLSIDFGQSRLPSLAEFVAGANAEPLQAVRQVCHAAADPARRRPQCVYLWGAAGVGKSHLLRAACMELHQQGLATACLEPGALPPTPAKVRELAGHALLCVDGLDCIAGNRDWEVALYDLYERMRGQGHALLAASRRAPAALPLCLPDLASRLGWGLVYRLRPLRTDDERLQALTLRARACAFTLPVDVARYLLQRFPRDMPTLCALLGRIDDASLADGRRVTLQFVRAYLDGQVEADTGVEAP